MNFKLAVDAAVILRRHGEIILSDEVIKPFREDLVCKAREFAMQKHTASYGPHPYVKHLDDVWLVLLEFGFDSSIAQVIAYLHDVLEDTQTSSEELEREFGKEATNYVVALSREKGPRKQKNAAMYQAIEQAGSIAAWVKMADRLANVRSCHATHNSNLLNMYMNEHQAFQAAIYPVLDGFLADAICDELDSLLEWKWK